MATRTRSGIYSPVSLEAINLITAHCANAPRLLIAYLVLARFTGMCAVGTHAPNMVTGAGATAVANAMKIRWARANDLVKKLQELGVIQKAEKGLVVSKSRALYVIQFQGDVNVPHSLIDGLNEVAGITRLLEPVENQPLQTITAAVVALVHCYRLHDMYRWGGVCPQAAHAPWVIHSVKQEGQGFKVQAIRGTTDAAKLGEDFEANLLPMEIQAANFSPATPALAAGLALLRASGLMYETVTLLDNKRQPILPIRINDAHAALSDSEQSYIEAIPGAGFYTHPGNSERKREGVHFLLPFDPTKKECSLMGVMRLRFRCCDSATAKGLERDALRLKKVKNQLVELDVVDDVKLAA